MGYGLLLVYYTVISLCGCTRVQEVKASFCRGGVDERCDSQT